MTTYTRYERIIPSKVRALCIKKEYFTCGDVAEYEKLFSMCEAYDGSVDDLQVIAEQIVNHSNPEMFEGYGKYEDIVAGIMFELINDCSLSTFGWETML